MWDFVHVKMRKYEIRNLKYEIDVRHQSSGVVRLNIYTASVSTESSNRISTLRPIDKLNDQADDH